MRGNPFYNDKINAVGSVPWRSIYHAVYMLLLKVKDISKYYMYVYCLRKGCWYFHIEPLPTAKGSTTPTSSTTETYTKIFNVLEGLSSKRLLSTWLYYQSLFFLQVNTLISSPHILVVIIGYKFFFSLHFGNRLVIFTIVSLLVSQEHCKQLILS